ncbi:MAG: hypothetical protein ACR2QC_00295 [Gammaproteobacteria bacterium]
MARTAPPPGEINVALRPIPAKAGISAPKAVIVKGYNYPPLCGGGDSCFRRNGNEIPAFAGMVHFN